MSHYFKQGKLVALLEELENAEKAITLALLVTTTISQFPRESYDTLIWCKAKIQELVEEIARQLPNKKPIKSEQATLFKKRKKA